MKAGRLASLAALVVLAVGSTLWAEAPAGSSAQPAGSARPPGFEKQRERLLEHLRERGLPLPGASGLPALPSGFAVPSGSGARPLPSSFALGEELSRRWRALAESRGERRERHRAALVRELGQHLSEPGIKAELKLHATRVAELSRIRFLAEHARSGAQREQLLARVTKLSAREDERHRTRLAALTGATPAPSASARAAPAPSGAAP